VTGRPHLSTYSLTGGRQATVEPEEGLKRTISWFASQHLRLSQPGLTDGGSGGA
jgi:hypothetical protein